MFSDYIVYVDESGDHNLERISPNFPIFVLAFCIFEKEGYLSEVVPSFQRLKFKWFGHDSVVFHEREIRQQQVPFKFLQNIEKRDEFHADLNAIMAKSNFTVIATIIDKKKLSGRYRDPDNPYEIGLQFCVERLVKFLEAKEQTNRTTHCIFECRGKKEDNSLELQFRKICDGANYQGKKIDCLDIQFVPKSANSSGLQISDLIARPIGIAELRPHQGNRAYEIIKDKFRKSGTGQIRGYGLKVFP
jgi:hypothetical protein